MALKLETALAVAIMSLTTSVTCHAQTHYSIGRSPTAAEIAGWNIDINREGNNLPAGSGDVGHGREVFKAQCSACHGDNGEGGIGDRLVGGQGTLDSAKPIRTVGSYWQYATTLFDYIRRAMPLNAPQSLSSDDTYALSAYILNINGIVPDNAKLDAKSLAAIKMPNRDGFISDPRPDVKNAPCMSGCKP